jgi:hypothetical protein
MEIYELKTTYDKDRKEFEHKGYRCRQDDTWGMLEIPKALLPNQGTLPTLVK